MIYLKSNLEDLNRQMQQIHLINNAAMPQLEAGVQPLGVPQDVVPQASETIGTARVRCREHIAAFKLPALPGIHITVSGRKSNDRL